MRYREAGSRNPGRREAGHREAGHREAGHREAGRRDPSSRQRARRIGPRALGLGQAVAVLLVGTMGCVGTDTVRESLPSRIDISPPATVAQVGGTVSFEATFVDGLGVAVPVTAFEWTSTEPAFATIDGQGRALGKAPGQTTIFASAKGVTSHPAVLTVVAGADQVAVVEVMPASVTLSAGETIQYAATARTVGGQAIPGRIFTWTTSDSNVASIDSAGLAEARTPGTSEIRAETDGVTSLPAILEVPGQSRSGSFLSNPATSYHVEGTATLEQAQDGSLTLTLGADFLSSAGPGLDVFLSRLAGVNSQSRSLGRLKSFSGGQSYAVPAGIGIRDFDHVVIHCVPFNVTFGYARLP